MATAEEILQQMEAEANAPVLVIDNDLRTIAIPDDVAILGVESDDDVHRLRFRMPKMCGEFDLSEFKLRVNIMNAGNEPDLYEVKDKAVEGDAITFSWLVGRTAAKYKGDVKFSVCAKLLDKDGVVQQEFNTTPAKLPVLEGLEVSEAVVQLHPDIIEAILLRLSKLETSGGVTDEQIANALSEYLQEHPIEAGATKEQAEQIEANKKAIEELQKGGTGGGIAEETDPTVPAWAKQPSKPTYTASEVGALPATTQIPTVPEWAQQPSKPTYTAAEVGALPATTQIPTVPETLPNPQPIVINGVSYDGSEKKEITVQAEAGAGIDDTTPSTEKTYSSKHIDDLLNAQKEANAKQDAEINALKQAGGIVTVEPAQDDVPLLFYGAALPQTKDEAIMSINYASKTLKRDDGDAETKAQGNSSMSYPKKNQTTKFSQAINFKGWGLQKKYCMKANWIDLTHARNIVSAQLWGDVVKSRANYLDLPELMRTSPNQGAIDGFPVLVYADGVYQGRYTINIPKDAWMANMDKTLDNHCILCGENYVSGCFRATANIDGNDWTDEIHDTVPNAIKTRWNEVISFVMNSTDEEFKANLSDYFYTDSLIDYYLFGLASCGLDAFGKNQLYMTYDGQKWIATMYDMDSTWGLYWNGSKFVASDYARTSYEDYASSASSGDGNLLYIRLEQNFYEELQSRWAELREGALSYANIMTRFERFIRIVQPHIVKEDYASTTGGGKFTGIPSQNTNHIQQIRSFVLARQTWTDEYVAALDGSDDGGDEGGEEPSDNVLYRMAEPTTFDGTNYVDTGVQLFAENKPFTLVVDWEHGDSAFIGNTHVVAHCINETSPWPGLVIQYSKPTIAFEYQVNQTQQVHADILADGISTDAFGRVKFVCRMTSDRVVTIVRQYDQSGQIIRTDGQTTYVQLNQALLLGCYQDTSGNKGRFAKGTMHECVVYDRALSDDEITGLFTSIPCTGITLDQSNLTFTAAGTQTLTATVTPSDTTDTVAWSSDDSSVASVSNGVVTAVSNGNATITATCGAYSATCAVNVSGIDTGGNEEEIPSEGIVYQLAQPTTFNGTSDYIDTGVKLFDTQKDFTVFMDCVNNVPSPTTTLNVAHAMNEVIPWPGFAVMASASGYETQIIQGVKCATPYPLNGLNKFKTIARVSGTAAYVRIVNTENSTVRENSKDITYTKVEQNLLLGCYQDANGTKGRFWSGTINRCVVWNRALSDDEIDTLFA